MEHRHCWREHGLLATLSYFTPIFSALFSSLILGVTLSNSFWQGVVMVTVGSLLCWLVTKRSEKLLVKPSLSE